MHNIVLLFAMLLAYLFGSICSAILVCRLMKLPDPRTQGSGNPGATNVLRLGGKKAAAITLLGDMLKGMIPVFLARLLGFNLIDATLIAFAAFFGHLFPVFFRFEGGKGVATLLGCLLALSWPVGIAWIATWILVACLFRYSSLAALIASALAPFYFWFATHHWIASLLLALMVVILIYRHKSNIMKLLAGQERKIGQKT